MSDIVRRRSPLNITVCEEIIWDRLKELRPGLAWKKTQIKASSYRFLERHLRMVIDKEIDAMATTGKSVVLGGWE